MPMPNAGWSGVASTAAASGDSENRSLVVDLDQLGRGLVVGPLAHPAFVAGRSRAASSVEVSGAPAASSPRTDRAGRRGGSSPR